MRATDVTWRVRRQISASNNTAAVVTPPRVGCVMKIMTTTMMDTQDPINDCYIDHDTIDANGFLMKIWRC